MFCMRYTERNQLALDTIYLQPTQGIPTGIFHIMQHEYIERIAQVNEGDYKKDPEAVFIKMLNNIGMDVVDQYLALNPLTMGNHGYEGGSFNATTGSLTILDGTVIDSPEAVVKHLESIVFHRLQSQIESFNEDARVKEILEGEKSLHEKIGPDILKTGYGFITMPIMDYYTYGYENYFMAFALYPEVMECHFSLQADLAILNNKAAVRAYKQGNLPPLYRLDHDIADSRGTLANVKSLDQIWLPHLARSLAPVLKTDLRMIWHCDGNLMDMVPRLIDIGIKGFQGFQYEDGMDYVKICKMKTKDNENLIIIGGVSVTRTLPMGKPVDVKGELKWLVENGPGVGLFLGTSSTITPGAPWKNIETLIEGLKYYRKYGRQLIPGERTDCVYKL